MSAIPKPVRPPKERKRIARSAPPKRKAKPMPRCKHCGHPHSAHVRTGHLEMAALLAQQASCQRCTACPGYAPARGIRQKRRTPLAALRRLADSLWTRIVHARPEACEVQRFYPHECKGGYQAMHGVPRTFSATRWLPIDGFKGCAGVHKYFSDRPEAWSALLLEAWGLETFRELWAKARASEPVDMDATVASLRAELARVGG